MYHKPDQVYSSEPSWLVHKIKGFLDLCHYNFPTSEICHYNSPILKFAITILHFFESCHFIRIRGSWTHSQTRVFSYGPKHTCCFFPFNSPTCGAHMSVSSSTFGLLQPSLCAAHLCSSPRQDFQARSRRRVSSSHAPRSM